MILRNNKAFTLIEMMIALLLLSGIISQVFLFFGTANSNYRVQESVTDAQGNLRNSVEYLSRQARNIIDITSLDTTADRSSITFTTIKELGSSDSYSNYFSLHDSGQSWTPNEFQYSTVEIINGTGEGQSNTITSNGTHTLYFGTAWTTIPNSSSLYRIVSTQSYRIDDGTYSTPCLVEATNGGSEVRFSDNVTGLTLQGYDDSGTATAVLGDIVTLELQMTTQAERKDREGSYFTYSVTDRVDLRN